MLTDAIDIHAVKIFAGPDVRDWPITTAITRVIFQPGTFQLEFTKQNGPGRWPDIVPPGWEGPLQWTLWPLVRVDGDWRTTAAIECWNDGKHGRYDGVGGPYSRGAIDWWYHVPEMKGTQPAAGEQAGFLVTTAVRRAQTDASWNPTHERSAIVVVTVPPNDSGVIDIRTDPVPVPDPGPSPNPTPQPNPTSDLLLVLSRLDQIQAQIEDLKEAAGIVALEGSQRLDEIKQRQDRAFAGRAFGSTITLTPVEPRATDRSAQS